MGRSIPKNCYENEERIPNNLYTDNCMEIIEETAFKSGRIGLAIKWILFFLEVCMKTYEIFFVLGFKYFFFYFLYFYTLYLKKNFIEFLSLIYRIFSKACDYKNVETFINL